MWGGFKLLSLFAKINHHFGTDDFPFGQGGRGGDLSLQDTKKLVFTACPAPPRWPENKWLVLKTTCLCFSDKRPLVVVQLPALRNKAAVKLPSNLFFLGGGVWMNSWVHEACNIRGHRSHPASYQLWALVGFFYPWPQFSHNLSQIVLVASSPRDRSGMYRCWMGLITHCGRNMKY